MDREQEFSDPILLSERADDTGAVPQVADGASHRSRRLSVPRRAGMLTAAVLVAGVATIPMVIESPTSTEATGSGVTGPRAETGSGDDTEGTMDNGAWRWESYGGIELQVPADWGYTTTAAPWCGPPPTQPPEPAVGRPGATLAIACVSPVAPVEFRAPHVWLGVVRDEGTTSHDHGWVEETRVVGEVTVSVMTPDPERRAQILDSARVVADVDVHGCPVQHPLADEPTHRPDPSTGGLEALGQPTDISACTYAIRHDAARGARVPLLASSRIAGAPAVALGDALKAAPQGVGPDDPGDCVPELALGDQALVLRISDAAGMREVYVRYDGCEGHGIDDGVIVRTMTAAVGEHALADPHAPVSLSASMAGLLR